MMSDDARREQNNTRPLIRDAVLLTMLMIVVCLRSCRYETGRHVTEDYPVRKLTTKLFMICITQYHSHN